MDLKTLQETPPWEWPPNAGKTFRKVLSNPQASESDRLIAAELAGDPVVINEELAVALLAIVANVNEPEELRVTAAISFGPVLETVDTDGFDDPDPDMAPPITELTFREIQELLRRLYFDAATPKLLRRRILEVSVRAGEEWHEDAIREAYASGDQEWMLTAVFAMRRVLGFGDLILDALKNPDPEIHYEAVLAAGNWELDAAWPHVVELLEDPDTPQPLLLAAIEAAGGIRPAEAREILGDFLDSDDEEIAEAAEDAISMAEASLGGGDDEEDEEEGEWVN
jgi:HEAT repeats